jgi:2-amino-4-hydroxy-6-hydroxymethyldihydropteridine diphosphokinase
MKHMRGVWFGLGSNLGDRLTHLQAAVHLFQQAGAFQDVSVSSVWSTTPVGGPAQPDYLNAVLFARSDLPARELLEFARKCEQEQARIRTERWGPRTLDIDILAIEGECHDTEELQVPHPRAHERAFVIAPLSDLGEPANILGRKVTLDLSGVTRTQFTLTVVSDADEARDEVTRR